MGKKVVIVDYQLGNLFSVNQALVNIGLEVRISSDPVDIVAADALVLPGVGAFKDAMDNLNNLGLIEPIKSKVASGTPLFGICLGLQLLFTESEEFGASKGLDLIDGQVKRFNSSIDASEKVRVPQIAWNAVFKPASRQWQGTPLEHIKDNEDMYFVHSYYVIPTNVSDVLTETYYHDLKYTSSILKDNIFACQFHPEKSAEEGIKIYKSWAHLNNLH